MEMAKVTSKGQITIPVSIRRRLSINEGDKLLFIDRPDGVMMVNPALLGSSQEYEASVNADYAAEAAKSAQPKTKSTEKVAATQVLEESEEVVATKSIPEPSPPSSSQREPAKVGNLDLDALLDEIRSIGQKI